MQTDRFLISGRWARILVATPFLCLAITQAGCNQDDASKKETPTKREASIKAQGQLLPAGGFVRLAATPGDIVEKIIDVGDKVEIDQEVVEMKSAKLRQRKLEALEAQRNAAVEERNLAIQQAEQQVKIAEEKLANVAERETALLRKDELIKLAEQQLQASQGVLQRLESISRDHLTSEFVGSLEIDRQRISVGEANLKVEQQRESLLQAKDELRYARNAALSEQRIATEMLETANKETALDVIDAQIAAVKEEIEIAKIKSPINGEVVAVNVKKGEASAQLPIIELANLDTIVCEVEVNERDARKIRPDLKAEIRSGAFDDEVITGKVVVARSPMIGRPSLKPLDPMARADFRAITTTIELDDSTLAREWLQLQVQVKILLAEDKDAASSVKETEDAAATQESVVAPTE